MNGNHLASLLEGAFASNTVNYMRDEVWFVTVDNFGHEIKHSIDEVVVVPPSAGSPKTTVILKSKGR